ncbi:hypothetical protein SAMN05444410_10824 [Hydrobacter penzbergensis]|uniref:Uncharacterized protein n=1 Tax=Hydrobacter penzbergensis TaxID=1235997 RepID=A0A8X8ICV4_9BACT|nr:hypothetical protein [Hydrobacter penzbergensis]SDX00937.1 hypothetical protein SAMN05444410_10824 [Hydrobacter penzbergensis]
MNPKAAKKTLLFVFVGSLCLCSILFTIARIEDLVKDSNYQKALTQLLKIYSVPLGCIIAGFFISEKKNGPFLNKQAFTVAIVLCSIWNLLIIGRAMIYIVNIFSSSDDISDVIVFIKDIPEVGSFLISGLLTYLFGKNEK